MYSKSVNYYSVNMEGQQLIKKNYCVELNSSLKLIYIAEFGSELCWRTIRSNKMWYSIDYWDWYKPLFLNNIYPAKYLLWKDGNKQYKPKTFYYTDGKTKMKGVGYKNDLRVTFDEGNINRLLKCDRVQVLSGDNIWKAGEEIKI